MPTEMTSFVEINRVADVLLKSGFLPKAIQTPAQAVAIIMTGRELGVGPMAALMSINVIQGKPTIAPALKLALAYQKIEGFKLNVTTSTAEKAVVVVSRAGETKEAIAFTLDDAKALGLADKDNWKKQPGTMLRWRAIDAALRLYAVDATLGLYSPEELDPSLAIDFSTGEVTTDALAKLETPFPANVAAESVVTKAIKTFQPQTVKKTTKNEKSWWTSDFEGRQYIFAKLGSYGVQDFERLGMKQTKKDPLVYYCQYDDQVVNGLELIAEDALFGPAVK